MKKSFAALAIIVTSACSQGQEANRSESRSQHPQAAKVADASNDGLSLAPAEKDFAVCREFSGLAAAIMGSRQAGFSMATLMEAQKDDERATKLVIKAFEAPRMTVAENQDRLEREFENSAYLSCIKGEW